MLYQSPYPNISNKLRKTVLQPFLFHPRDCRNQNCEGHVHCDKAHEALCQESDCKGKNPTHC